MQPKQGLAVMSATPWMNFASFVVLDGVPCQPVKPNDRRSLRKPHTLETVPEAVDPLCVPSSVSKQGTLLLHGIVGLTLA